MKKRVISLVSAIALSLSLCIPFAGAADITPFAEPGCGCGGIIVWQKVPTGQETTQGWQQCPKNPRYNDEVVRYGYTDQQRCTRCGTFFYTSPVRYETKVVCNH